MVFENNLVFSINSVTAEILDIFLASLVDYSKLHNLPPKYDLLILYSIFIFMIS